jgi:hypothetical protein
MKNHLPQILHDNNIDNLSIEQWVIFEYCQRLLLPFAEFTELLAKETDPTISLVLLSVFSLSDFLNVLLQFSFSNSSNIVIEISVKYNRFAYYCGSSDNE